eukprot:3510924-Pyramimonas_sp.AAC.1
MAAASAPSGGPSTSSSVGDPNSDQPDKTSDGPLLLDSPPRSESNSWRRSSSQSPPVPHIKGPNRTHT